MLDVGGSDVNDSSREMFADRRFRYVTVDADPNAKVDVFLEDPYRLPMDDASVAVVISGQMLEHAEFFWLTFAETMRVLKTDGHLFLISPSAGPIHRYPVDCYRAHPDAYSALAKFANCHLIEMWLDEPGPWRDLVGVFAKNLSQSSSHAIDADPPVSPPLDPGALPKGAPEEEVTRGELACRETLARIHTWLEPSLYLEIDDLYPCHPAQAERVRRTRVWTGDGWRLHSALKKARPDLILVPLDTNPTGLLLVAGLDPKICVLWEEYNPLVREFGENAGPLERSARARGGCTALSPGRA